MRQSGNSILRTECLMPDASSYQVVPTPKAAGDWPRLEQAGFPVRCGAPYLVGIGQYHAGILTLNIEH